VKRHVILSAKKVIKYISFTLDVNDGLKRDGLTRDGLTRDAIHQFSHYTKFNMIEVMTS